MEQIVVKSDNFCFEVNKQIFKLVRESNLYYCEGKPCHTLEFSLFKLGSLKFLPICQRVGKLSTVNRHAADYGFELLNKNDNEDF